MSPKVAVISIVITVIAIVGIAMYTNVFQLAKPSVETSINFMKDLVSKIQGKDIVSQAEKASSDVKNLTSQSKVQNPLEPKQ